ncbi:ComEC/Rec2 family competence protein [Ochrobactrum teleogrylli]|uniref:ComEC family competence protein n=1 Tax=Ochrobactrum teleogrylli TaxID=2479765 RepID=A0ABY2Y4Y1_9HYPH|nr:ComEC/Rec2 family competence protein [[Ochrobactrum] teleogrylli]TNV16003.1 ComEC family competence protein [[Ochrobactrum] teleogrylli]
MTRIGDMAEANERALVKSLPDGLTRSYLPEPWPDPAIAPAERRDRDPSQIPTPDDGRSAVKGLARRAPAAFAEAVSLEAARGIFFLLIPIFSGLGAIAYFTVSFEPDWTPVLALLTGLAVIRLLARKHFLVAQILTLALAFQMGLVSGKWETERRATPMLGSDVSTRITGRVVALEAQDNGRWRITLDLLATERPKLRFAPERIRINARDIPAETTIGGGLTGFARLRVPSGPVRPGNYDFSFHAYFNGIGANGFFLGNPKTAHVPPQTNLIAAISEWVALLRVRVSERVEEVIGGEDGNVTAALIAGTRGGISEETNENLRKAGLAHILSISGLHMALAAGVVMFVLRSGFALFPAFSVRHPVKKYAAFLSLLSCTFYLAMSGADVAAQRSYVMIAVMLSALLFDRAAISMRNLAIAGMVTIAISPHEILGPSFQMSYSATAALIAGYAWWSARKAKKLQDMERRVAAPVGGLAAKALNFVFAAAGTSLLAGLASGIFAAYHFNNTAPLGLIGNVLADPVIAVLVMPFAVFGLVLMPLGLDWIPLSIAGSGVWIVRQIASFVASWSPEGNPGAIPLAALAFWTTALVIAVLFTTRFKILALPFVLLGFIAFVREPFPDVVISEDAKLVGVRLSDGRFAVNRDRPSKFTVDNWQTAYLAPQFLIPQHAKDRLRGIPTDGFICEDGLCTITLRDGRVLVYTADPMVQDVACDIGDVIILAVAGEMPGCTRANKLVLNRRDLALRGTVEIRLGEKSTAASASLVELSNPATDESGTTPQRHRFADPRYDDTLAFAIDEPRRPWHLFRLYSRAARGLPDWEYRKKPTAPVLVSNCPADDNQEPGKCE